VRRDCLHMCMWSVLLLCTHRLVSPHAVVVRHSGGSDAVLLGEECLVIIVNLNEIGGDALSSHLFRREKWREGEGGEKEKWRDKKEPHL
jgi:hypothetical protein